MARPGLANLSLSIAFTLSFLLAPGAKALKLLIDAPVLQSIPVYQAHVLNALANYWVVALLVYLLLRVAKAECWLKPRPAIHALFGAGNAILVIYLVPRILASTVQGGGSSYVVAMFSPFFVGPAQLLFFAGFLWLGWRSMTQRKDLAPRKSFTLAEHAGMAAMLAVPVAYVASMYFGHNAPFRIAREAGEFLDAKCLFAGERITRRPQKGVTGLYFERDGGEYYEKIEGGVYQAFGSSGAGDLLVNTGLLLFMERPNDRVRPEDGGQFKYRRHGLKDWKGQPVNKLSSEFGLYHKDLTTDAARKLGVRGGEITIRDLATDEVTATTTYYVSSRQRRFCGMAPDGSFSARHFAVRALGLEKRYPSISDAAGQEKK